MANGRSGKVEFADAKLRVVRVRTPDGKVYRLTKNNEIEKLQAEPKYKHGSTQAAIPKGSHASFGLDLARRRIDYRDVAGDGKEVGGDHVTVKYGIKGDDVEGIKKYLASLAPFDATLGKTEKFPPTEHSDGAAVIHAPVISPELERINREIEKHGEFAPSNFPDYRPHATVAYVKPEKADKYVGMKVTDEEVPRERDRHHGQKRQTASGEVRGGNWMTVKQRKLGAQYRKLRKKRQQLATRIKCLECLELKKLAKRYKVRRRYFAVASHGNVMGQCAHDESDPNLHRIRRFDCAAFGVQEVRLLAPCEC